MVIGTIDPISPFSTMYAERRVPELLAELKHGSWVVKGLSPAPVRRGEGGEEGKMQTILFGSMGGFFLAATCCRIFVLANVRC